MTTLPRDSRGFAYFRRGQIRDEVLLAAWRNSLRTATNPDTGITFTEDEIARATQPGTRWYHEADAIDLLLQTEQGRGLSLADGVRPTRANTATLESLHAPLWGMSRRSASGGGGLVTATATVGTIFVGSSTMPDPLLLACTAVDPNGYRYQVLTTAVCPVAGSVTLQLEAIDTGSSTNPEINTVLTWSTNKPLGADPTCLVQAAFAGGFDSERDADLAERIEERMSRRPASGNPAHFVAWAQEADAAVETAFVYPCAMYSGSVVVTPLQRRSSDGPLARTATGPSGVLANVSTYVTPPGSPVVPEQALVVCAPANSQGSDLVVRLSMGYGQPGGWSDSSPWPNPDDSSLYLESTIDALTSQTVWTIETDSDLPGGATSLVAPNAPQLMAWDESTSRWEELHVQSVALAGTTASVVLSQAPSFTLVAGTTRISPFADLHESIATAAEAYFDELGPGEIVETTDPRWGRAMRYPSASELYTYRAGTTVLTRISTALSGASIDSDLPYISRSTPDVAASPCDGPNQVTLQHLTVYPL